MPGPEQISADGKTQPKPFRLCVSNLALIQRQAQLLVKLGVHSVFPSIDFNRMRVSKS